MTVAILGTARSDFTQSVISELHTVENDLHLIVKVGREKEFSEKSAGKITTFDGDISWKNRSLLFALRSVQPDKIVIVIGDQFFHSNVLDAINLWTELFLIKKADVFLSYSFAPGNLELWDENNDLRPTLLKTAFLSTFALVVWMFFGIQYFAVLLVTFAIVKGVLRPSGFNNRARNYNSDSLTDCKNKYHIITAVWGDAFTDLFLNTAIPNQLAQGNLPFLAKNSDCIYKIYTTSRDAKKIASHPNFLKITSIINTEIITPDHLCKINDYSVPISILLMTRCHRMATSSAALNDVAIIFLTPDSIWSDGTFKKIDAAVRGGKRAVMTLALRTAKESILPEISDRFITPDGILPIPPRELAKLTLKHLHPLYHSCFIDSDKFTKTPVVLLWKINKDWIIGRGIYFHTLMIHPRDKKAVPYGAIDTDFLARACPDYRDYHVVTDSDEIAGCEISDMEKESSSITPNRFSMTKYAKYIKTRGEKIHFRLLKETVHLHSEDIAQSDMKAHKKLSHKIVRNALLLKTVV